MRYSQDGVTFEDFGSDGSADYEDVWLIEKMSHVVNGLTNTVYFRIYGYEAGAVDKRWCIDDVVSNGTVYEGIDNPLSQEFNPSGIEHTLYV